MFLADTDPSYNKQLRSDSDTDITFVIKVDYCFDPVLNKQSSKMHPLKYSS